MTAAPDLGREARRRPTSAMLTSGRPANARRAANGRLHRRRDARLPVASAPRRGRAGAVLVASALGRAGPRHAGADRVGAVHPRQFELRRARGSGKSLGARRVRVDRPDARLCRRLFPTGSTCLSSAARRRAGPACFSSRSAARCALRRCSRSASASAVWRRSSPAMSWSPTGLTATFATRAISACSSARSAGRSSSARSIGVLLTALLVVPLVARMRAEEALLGEHFGEAYAAYRARSWRLIPWLY